jgi:hypothetical protein
MRDKSLGSLIFIVGLIGSIGYLYWLFGPAKPEWLFLINGIRWAIVLPIACIVLAILFTGMWIGWTMAVTPAPSLIEEEIQTDEEKEKK